MKGNKEMLASGPQRRRKIYSKYNLSSIRASIKNLLHTSTPTLCSPGELVMAIRRSLQGEEVPSLEGGLVLEAGL